MGRCVDADRVQLQLVVPAQALRQQHRGSDLLVLLVLAVALLRELSQPRAVPLQSRLIHLPRFVSAALKALGAVRVVVELALRTCLVLTRALAFLLLARLHLGPPLVAIRRRCGVELLAIAVPPVVATVTLRVIAYA